MHAPVEPAGTGPPGLTIPVTAPPAPEIVVLLKSWTASQVDSAGDGVASGPAEQGLGTLIDALYGFIERNRRAVQLIQQCAAALPELAQWWFVQQRRGAVQRIGDYLRDRIEAGELRPVADIPVAARFIVETITWFAMHRHTDPDSAMLDDDACRRTVRHLLLAAFLPALSAVVHPAGRVPWSRAVTSARRPGCRAGPGRK